jgi:protein-tyrosine-phosphatase
VSVLLFVCTGNLCRSPMAEALLRQRLEDANLTPRVQVRSAGVWAQEGRPASAEAIEVMAERALDIEDHRAHVLTAEDMAEAELVLVMSREHLDYVRAAWPQYAYKVRRLAEMAGRRRDIEDPYGKSRRDYRETANEIDRYLRTGWDAILEAL